MTITIYGGQYSNDTQRVLFALLEKDLEFRYIRKGDNGIDLDDAWHSINPFVKIPEFDDGVSFEDGDLKLFGSRAITNYIAHAYADKGTPLIAEDPKEMAIISVWLEVETQKFDVIGKGIQTASTKFFQDSYITYGDKSAVPNDEALLEQLMEQMGQLLDVYEVRLAESEYIAGNYFSLADLNHAPILVRFWGDADTKPLVEDRSHVNEWLMKLIERPACAASIDPSKFETYDYES